MKNSNINNHNNSPNKNNQIYKSKNKLNNSNNNRYNNSNNRFNCWKNLKKTNQIQKQKKKKASGKLIVGLLRKKCLNKIDFSICIRLFFLKNL